MAEFYYNYQLDNEEENKVVITTGDRIWVDISPRPVVPDIEGRCLKCENFVKSIYHNYCGNCGRELPSR